MGNNFNHVVVHTRGGGKAAKAQRLAQ